MVDLPYSGAAVRGGHYSSRPPVPGVNTDHVTPDPEPDPFNPVPNQMHNQTANILISADEDAGQSGAPNLAQQPIHHWYNGELAVPSNVPTATSMQAVADRMLVDHSNVNYVPDSIRLYQHATEGQVNQFLVGRMPVNAGVDPGENLQYLVMGRNSYDATNKPNEVYEGDAANVGRYRLGVKTNVFGLYDNPLSKFGQDAQLHSYRGLRPQFPVDKPPMDNTAPYTPNSTGTAHWLPAAFAQVPSMFSLPSETALTDYSASEFADNAGSEFVDTRGGF
jgi:hypothetical protein